MTRSIPETAVMVIGSLGRVSRVINCKLGHSAEKVMIVEATIASGKSDSKLRVTEVILGERNKEMNGINDSSISNKWRVFRFGSKGPLMVQSWMTEKTSKDREFRVPH